jgi:peptidoglycan/xylan/chitin deacetylase (PgdA/CDA1 family)
LIASGRVRRARKAALAGGVVTAIYFHNPGKALFRGCIRWLLRNGYVFVSAEDVVNFLRGGPIPRGAVWISFDDGYRDMLANVLPIIRQHSIPATVFLPSGILQGRGLFPWIKPEKIDGSDGNSGPGEDSLHRHCLTVPELKEMLRDTRVTIGAHTVGHVITAGCDEERLRFELEQSRRDLESLTNRPVHCFAYPNGLFDGREHKFLDEFQYSLAATTENAFVTPATEPYLVPRFSIADSIWLPEAICDMTGVWKPAIDTIKRIVRLRTPQHVEAVSANGIS